MAIRTAPMGDAGDGGPAPRRSRRRPCFHEALLPRVFAAVNAGGPPFAEGAGRRPGAGSPPRMAAADDVAFHEPIHQSMAEAFTAAGGVVGTRTIVLHQDPPVGFLGPVVAAPPTGPRRCGYGTRWWPWPPCPVCWSSRVPRPPRPEVPGVAPAPAAGLRRSRVMSGSSKVMLRVMAVLPWVHALLLGAVIDVVVRRSWCNRPQRRGSSVTGPSRSCWRRTPCSRRSVRFRRLPTVTPPRGAGSVLG
jgi:hypothetical protein